MSKRILTVDDAATMRKMVSFTLKGAGHEVLEVNESTYERAPETLTGVARQLVRGVYKLKDRLLLIIDTDQTVDLHGKLSAAAIAS